MKQSEADVLKTICINPSNTSDYVDGWLKVELNGAKSFTLKVKHEESKSVTDTSKL